MSLIFWCGLKYPITVSPESFVLVWVNALWLFGVPFIMRSLIGAVTCTKLSMKSALARALLFMIEADLLLVMLPTRSFTVTPFSFPIPVKTSSWSLIRSIISGCPTAKIGSLMFSATWRLRSAVFPWLCTRHPLYSFGSGLGMQWNSWSMAIPVPYHLLSNFW